MTVDELQAELADANTRLSCLRRSNLVPRQSTRMRNLIEKQRLRVMGHVRMLEQQIRAQLRENDDGEDVALHALPEEGIR